MKISFSKVYYVLASGIALVVVLSFARGVLIPIAFALLFSLILHPAVQWLLKKGVSKILAIFMALIGVSLVFSMIMLLFSTQIVDMAGQFSNFVGKLKETLDSSVSFLNDRLRIIPDLESQELLDRLGRFFSDSSFVIISDTVGFTSTFFSFLILSLIYTFLILFYSDHLTQALISFNPEEEREEFKKMLKEVQKVGNQYFTGMTLLILVLGILNSVGLLLLGIDYSFFFGFLAAILAIIPYVGTALGGLIPTVYAFMTYDSYWYPIGVIAIFWFIQFLEGNFLNPKIVGGKVKLNALFSILSLIIGGYLWGIAGMILFLPLLAMFKVVCSYYDELKPLAQLLSDPREHARRVPFWERVKILLRTE